MGREIKFRFWSKILNHFVVPDDSIFIGALSDEKMIPMQFTGLHDKNGHLIFEGDIVQVEGAIPAEIYWEYCSWQLRNGDKTGGMLGNWESDQIEVIGNIYENPDLLT